MRKLIVVMFASALFAGTLSAQKIAFDVDTRELSAKAIETVEVTLDGEILKLASKFLAAGEQDAEAAAMIRGLQGIYVRSYTFAEDGAYDAAMLGRFRSQIGTGWQKIVSVKSADQENVEIYTHLKGDAITGLVVIAAEPRELTLVNIVGPIDLARLSSLEGQFGVPRISASSGKPASKVK
ncbi:MAG: DUF4252 domain-containing protein [Thermoanaerobaculia bacterium]